MNPKQTNHTLWQALGLFNLYRLILSLLFFIIYALDSRVSIFNIASPEIYKTICLSYLVTSISFSLLSVFYKRHFQIQANISIFIDLITIILIMHLSGGVLTGLGILLIIIVAAHSLLVPGKISLFGAAFATLGLIFEHTYDVLKFESSTSSYTHVGLIGATLFATALITYLLALRAVKTQHIVDNQSKQLATSKQLNAYIISAMHAGVIVLDSDHQIRLINAAAKMLLGIKSNLPLNTLYDLPTFFQEKIFEWSTDDPKTLQSEITLQSPNIRLNFHPLGSTFSQDTLIFIHNTLEETKHAQNLKFSSLSHLTANIAHELRNPLGAASHATQLLAESKELSLDDLELIKVIKNSCDRMNKVIQNILSLSGRKQAHSQIIELIPWLEQFINELILPNIPRPQIKLEYDARNYTINFDPTQLTQILINLCENGLRYSLKKNRKATLTLRVQASTQPNAVCIYIIDQGEGITPEVAKYIFEPFFTTENTGTGLGLYIAKELTQMNGAKLDLSPNEKGGQFEITIPQRGII